MNRSRLKYFILTPLILLLLFLVLIAYSLFREMEYYRYDSPDGNYTVIGTFYAYEAMIPMFPGQSGDKPGFVSIEGKDGTEYGRIPVPMVSMCRDVRWFADGADLGIGGEWNFRKREYSYWNEEQTEKIVKRGVLHPIRD